VPDSIGAIRYEVDDPVGVITIDRPDALGAFTFDMLEAFRDAVLQASADPAVVGIVVTGTGRGFCVGLDAAAMSETTQGATVAEVAHGHGPYPGMFSYLLDQPKPVIAAINGVTAGGGYLLATMCDLRFASTDASFVTVFARRGLVGELGVTWTLPRLVGTGNALDLLWSSRPIDASEAHRIGLVEHITQPEELVATARDYVRTLAREVAPSAVAGIKHMVYEEAGMPVGDALSHAKRATEDAMVRPDAVEGAAAFAERRTPRFDRIPSPPPHDPDGGSTHERQIDDDPHEQ
jgi:enoyl-CoA hydratase/carnithine racemase